MADDAELRPGARVSWMTSQGRTRGVVMRKATAALTIKSFRIDASRADPRWVVKSDASGDLAAHKATALRPLKRRKGEKP